MKKFNLDHICRELTPTTYICRLHGQKLGRGKLWKETRCLNPGHSDDGGGNFYINLQKGCFKCHSCGISGGSIISLHMISEGMTFVEAVKDLVARSGISEEEAYCEV